MRIWELTQPCIILDTTVRSLKVAIDEATTSEKVVLPMAENLNGTDFTLILQII